MLVTYVKHIHLPGKVAMISNLKTQGIFSHIVTVENTQFRIFLQKKYKYPYTTSKLFLLQPKEDEPELTLLVEFIFFNLILTFWNSLSNLSNPV